MTIKELISASNIEKLLLTLLIFFLPFDRQFLGIILSVSIIKIIAFLLMTSWIYLIFKFKISLKYSSVGIIFIILFITSIFSSIFSPQIPNPDINNLILKLNNSLRIIFIGIFISLAYLNLNKEKIHYIMKIHCSFGIFFIGASLLLLISHILNIWPNNFAVSTASTINKTRLFGFSVEPQAFGSYLLLLIPFYLYNCLSPRPLIFNRITNFLLFISGILSLLATISFGSYFGLISCIFLYLIIFPSHIKKIIIPLFSSLLIIFIIITLTPKLRTYMIEYASDRVILEAKLLSEYSLQNKNPKAVSSFTNRIDNLRIAFREWKSNPIFGVGPGSYGYFYDNYRGNLDKADWYPQVPQNFFAGNLANLGLLGFIPLILIFLIIFKDFIYYWYINTMHEKDPIIALSFIAAISDLITQQSHFTPWALNMWLFFVIGQILVHRNKVTLLN